MLQHAIAHLSSWIPCLNPLHWDHHEIRTKSLNHFCGLSKVSHQTTVSHLQFFPQHLTLEPSHSVPDSFGRPKWLHVTKVRACLSSPRPFESQSVGVWLELQPRHLCLPPWDLQLAARVQANGPPPRSRKGDHPKGPIRSHSQPHDDHCE